MKRDAFSRRKREPEPAELPGWFAEQRLLVSAAELQGIADDALTKALLRARRKRHPWPEKGQFSRRDPRESDERPLHELNSRGIPTIATVVGDPADAGRTSSLLSSENNPIAGRCDASNSNPGVQCGGSAGNQFGRRANCH